MLGIFLVLPVFTLYGLQFTKSHFLVGLAFGCYPLMMAILQIPAGRLSDRIGRHKVLMMGMAVFSAGSFVCAMPAWFPQRSQIWVLMLGRLVQGVGAIVSTAFAAVADHIEPEQRSLAMAAVGIPIGAAFAIGIVAGPFIASLAGPASLFWMTGVLALVGEGLLLGYLPATHAQPEAATPVIAVLRIPDMLRLDGAGFLLNFFMSAFFFLFPLMVRSQLGLGPREYYEILLPMLLANAAAMFIVSRAADKGFGRSLAIIAFIIMAASAVLLFRPETVDIRADRLLSILLPGAMFFIAFGGLEPVLPGEVSRLAPKDAYGTALGAYNTLQFLGSAAGSAAAGALSRLPSSFLMITLALSSLLGVTLIGSSGLARSPSKSGLKRGQ
jgi:MFS family permease